jgi:branched-chain amino acid transport system substrate-binding protein
MALLAGCDKTPEECEEEGACVVIEEGDPIRLGVGAPMSGDIEADGLDAQRGVEIALADAGEFEGYMYEMDPKDDEGDPDVADDVAQEFADDESIVAIVGHAWSGATLAALPIYEDARIPVVSQSATNMTLTQQGFEVFNRVIASDLFQGDLVAEVLYTDMGARSLAVIHDDSAYGEGLADRVEELFAGLGGTVVVSEEITTGLSDYGGVLTTIAAATPDSVFFGGYDQELAVLLNQCAAAGLDTIPWLGADAVLGGAILTGAGANAEGLYATGPATPAESAAKTAFDAAYLDGYGEEAGSLTPFSWFAYDAASVIIAAIEDTAIVEGDTLYIPKEDLITAVRGTSGFQGLTGDITCDANGECKQGGFALFQVDSGAWVEVP